MVETTQRQKEDAESRPCWLGVKNHPEGARNDARPIYGANRA